MSYPMSTSVLPSGMELTLKQIGRRQAMICVIRAIAIGLCVLVAGMIVAMLIDWQLTLFDTRLRIASTIAVLLTSLCATAILAVPSFRVALRRIQSASDADAEIPQLEERWQTVVTMAGSGRQPTSPIAAAMLRQVTSEAVAIGRFVSPQRVANPTALAPTARTLAACLLALLGFLAIDWRQTSVLLHRFWLPASEITATQLQCVTGDISIPRGEHVQLVAHQSGLLRTSATLTVVRSAADHEALEVSPDAKQPETFSHRVQVDESFRYRVRAGDGQTEWHTVTVVDFPALADVRLTVIAPAYLSRPNVEKNVIPARLKVMQGSLLELRMRPKAALERLELMITTEGETSTDSLSTSQTLSLSAQADGWYTFQTQLMKDVSLSPRLWNASGLTNEDPQTCRIQVVADSAPVARVLSPTDEMAVATDEIIDIKFEAHDDHGIARAELIVYDESSVDEGKPARVLAVIPIPLGDQQLEKRVLGTAQLDLKKLALKPGTQISYTVRVTDNRMASSPPDESSPETVDDANGPSREESQTQTEGPIAAPTEVPLGDAQRTSKQDGPKDSTKKGVGKAVAETTQEPTEPAESDETRAVRKPQSSGRNDVEIADRAEPVGEQGEKSPAQNPAEVKANNPKQTMTSERESDRGDSSSATVAMMTSQQSESGQNTETNRRRLKITERMIAVAASQTPKIQETNNVRERVVAINGLLEEVEVGLTGVVNREIPDSERLTQIQNLDQQLGTIEATISQLRNDTRDHQFAFVGLQMMDINRGHVTPARERVFVAIREPATGADSNTRKALQQIIRARELLTALLTRYDRVAREKKLAESLKETAKMYEIYVEKSLQLLREARQNSNPLERKMAIIEVGQDYLTRYSEVLVMRREMMAEFARILGDDPRLLARYLDLVKRRRTSLRAQLAELAKRQQEATAEVSGWLGADPLQRDDLWALIVELRMQASTPLAKDSAELAERIERQFPLVLEANQRVQQRVIALGKIIAETSRDVSLEARRQIRQPDAVINLRPKADLLVRLFVDLEASLEQLNFEHSKEAEVTGYATSRILESRTVADQADAWSQIAGHVQNKRFHGLVEVDQHRLAIVTELLRVDMLKIETDLSGQFRQYSESPVPAEISTLIRELHQLMEQITFDQASATFAMSKDQLKTAELLQIHATAGFAKAEELFDRIRRDVAAALDEFEVKNPTVADLEDPTLDKFLAQLEREPNIEAQLGLPERPRNLRVIADELAWQTEGGGQLGDSEEAAAGRAKDEMRVATAADPKVEKTEKPPEQTLTEDERAERERARLLEQSLAKALAEYKERADDPATDPAVLKKLGEAAMELQDKIKQMSEETNADNLWRLVAEFERKKEILKSIARGEKIPDEQWNKLLSTLDDGLWQVGSRTPPENYRKAIEQYQDRIRRLTGSSDHRDR